MFRILLSSYRNEISKIKILKDFQKLLFSDDSKFCIFTVICNFLVFIKNWTNDLHGFYILCVLDNKN